MSPAIARLLICAQYVQENGKVEAIARASNQSEWCTGECDSTTCKLQYKEGWYVVDGLLAMARLHKCKGIGSISITLS